MTVVNTGSSAVAAVAKPTKLNKGKKHKPEKGTKLPASKPKRRKTYPIKKPPEYSKIFQIHKEKIEKVSGSSGLIKWLFTKYGEKSYSDHLLEKTFTEDNIVTMIGNDGAKQAMNGFLLCWRKSQLDHLLEKNFKKRIS